MALLVVVRQLINELHCAGGSVVQSVGPAARPVGEVLGGACQPGAAGEAGAAIPRTRATSYGSATFALPDASSASAGFGHLGLVPHLACVLPHQTGPVPKPVSPQFLH